MRMFKGRVQRIHFVGIGGIGMSGIAEVLLNLGYQVSGSDAKAGENTQRLLELGGEIAIGHSADHVDGSDVVVTSSAISPDNPEVAAAHASAIPVIRRAEMLAELMRMKHGIGVAGSHGKTTTTSILAALLGAGELDPTVVIGGTVNQLGSNARLGRGDYLVAEADESDGSFMTLTPTVAVITNIDPEHLDHYGDLTQLRETFLAFANKVPFYGLAVLCLDCANVQAIVPDVRKRMVTYGTSAQADYSAIDIESRGLSTHFRLLHRGQPADRFEARLVGEHNVLNCLAAIAVADELEIPRQRTREALAAFAGIQRRFTVLGEARQVAVVDDYGHHPTEIKATLAGARAAFGTRRLIAIVQPHRYSRLSVLFEDFARSFYDADVVIVTPVYPAGEVPIEGVDSVGLAAAIREHGHRNATAVSSFGEVLAALRHALRPADVVITLGAGDIGRLARELLVELA